MTDTPASSETDTSESSETAAAPIARPRKPWLAAVLSFLATGLGQVYNGQWKKGLSFFAVDLALGVVMILMLGRFWTMVAGLALLVAYNVGVAWEAYRTARGLPQYVLGPANRMWLYLTFFVLSATAGALIQMGLGETRYRSFAIPSGSMVPALLPGDRIMVERLDPNDAVQRGDLAVFLSEDGRIHFVKRVVGLPGETVTIRDRRVFIDGERFDEPYVHHTKFHIVAGRDNFGPLALGEDEFFLLGDNRDSSMDSRMLGPIPRSAVTGRALYVFFPGQGLGNRWARLGQRLR